MTDRPDWHSEDQPSADREDSPEKSPDADRSGDGKSRERSGSTGTTEPTGSAEQWGSSGRRSQKRRTRRSDRLGEPASMAEATGQEDGPGIVGREREAIPIEQYTTDRCSLAPVVQLQWSISAAIAAIILGLVATAALTTVDVSPLAGAASVLLFLLLAAGWVVLRYRVWVYQIRDDAIYLERGVVRHVRTLVPYVRIQHVDTSRGPVERALGLSTLVVYTAGSRGADVSIPGLRPHEASDLQQRIKELAIEAKGDDAL